MPSYALLPPAPNKGRRHRQGPQAMRAVGRVSESGVAGGGQVAGLGVPYALMHMRGDPCTMVLPENTAYGDVATEVGVELQAQAEAALSAGIQPWRILLDPGASPPPPLPTHPRTGTPTLPAAAPPCTLPACRSSVPGGRPGSSAHSAPAGELCLALPPG